MEQRERSAWPLPVGLIVAAIAGFVIYQSPLKSSRPISVDSERLRALGERQVQARLWQDPLAAVEAHTRAEAAKGATFELRVERGAAPLLEKGVDGDDHHRFGTLTDEIARTVTQSSGAVTVLAVMVQGGPYVEGIESRIRTRYAVVSALGVACFVPEDSEHIGYAQWKPHPPPGATLPYDKLNVPYEWYRSRKFQECGDAALQLQNVLVLWLNEDAFSDEPLRRLSWLTADVKGRIDGRRIRVKAIGPASSTTLRGMLEDAIDHPHSQSAPDRLPLYSPWATAHPGLLALSLQGKLDSHGIHPYSWYEEQFGAVLGHAVDLHRGIGSDDRLAQVLFEELHRRGVEIGQDHIAWLAEWDSFYSRALQMEFSAAACVVAERNHPAPNAVCPDTSHAMDAVVREDPQLPWSGRSWLHRYSYLRGLDGEIPSDKAGKEKSAQSGTDATKATDKDAKSNSKEPARPEGQSQLDYVQRLVDQMEADAARWEGSGKELKAIGVLGSDVYDKLLILQAVRKRFPNAIFFTTDLDARLLHSSQYEWTRNLVIASHFGLQLHPTLQSDIPSFRDSYQTSAFFSVLHSLGHVTSMGSSHGAPLEQDVSMRPTAPRIYEVGRTQPIDLSLDAVQDTTVSRCENAPEHQRDTKMNLHPARAMFELWHETGCGGLADSLHNLRYNHAMWGVIAVFLACVLLIPFDVALAKAIFAGVALLGATVFLFWRLSLDPAGEPFYWVEGVSIWPTEVFRVIAAALSLSFLYRAVNALRRNRVRMTDEIKQHTEQEAFQAAESLAAKPGWRAWVNPSAWGICYSHRHTTLMSLWDEYRRLSEPAWRRSRVIPQAAVYGFFGFALLLGVFTPPHTPFRGLVSEGVDKVVLFLSVFTFIALTFFVVDETRLCEQFIRRLTDLSCLTHQSEPRFIRFSVDVVAARSKVVSRLIDYPFIILLILIVGRMRLFDNWDVPLGLILLWGISAGYAVVCAFLLGRAAEHLRQAAIMRLKPVRDEAKAAGEIDRAERLDHDLQGIETESRGAFAPWTQHPIFRAILFPTGGFGLASLLEYFSFS